MLLADAAAHFSPLPLVRTLGVIVGVYLMYIAIRRMFGGKRRRKRQ